MKKFATVLVAVMIAVVLLTACDSTTFELVFDDGFGDSVTVQATAGGTYELPAREKEGYEFLGWKEKDGDGALLPAGTQILVIKSATYIAEWKEGGSATENGVTVTFMNGDEQIDSVTVEAGGELTFPACEVTKDNFVFGGWSFNGATYKEGDKVVVTEDGTATAVWNAIKVVVVFVDGDEELDAYNLDKGSELTFPECETTKDNYVFCGWSFNGSVYAAGDKVVVTGSGKAAAVWNPIELDIELVSDGEVIGTLTVNKGTELAFPACEVQKDNEKFAGWSFNGATYKEGDKVVVTEGGTATAVWAPIELSVGFVSDGVIVDTLTVNKGTELTFPACSVVNENFEFAGWSFNGVTYREGDKVVVTESGTATAVWNPIELTIVFMNEGTEQDTVVINKGDELTFPECENQKDNYVFCGWSFNGSVYDAGDTLTVKEGGTATAVWEPVELKIEFVNGEEVVDTRIVDWGSELTFPEAPKAAPGKAFAGWSFKEETYMPGDKITATAQGQAVAKWSDIEYTVKFVKADGTVLKTQTLLYGDMPVAPEVADEIIDETTVSAFIGWGEEVTAVTCDKTYTAVFSEQARKYPLTFIENEYVTFVSLTGETLGEEQREFNEGFEFKLDIKTGVNTQNLKVTFNGEELIPADGVYSAPFAADGSVGVEGLFFAEYSIPVTAKNVAYMTDMPEAVTYGSVITIYAVGNEWYTDNAPTVTYNGEEIAYSGKEVVEGVEYYVYEVVATKNGTISVSGVEDVIPVTYVDLNGNRETLDWTVSKYPVTTTGFYYVNVWGSYLLEGTTKLYSVAYAFDSNYDTYVSMTKEERESYFVTQKEAEAVVADLIENRVYPVKGEENVFYLLYYYVGEDETAATDGYSVGFTSPVGATDMRYFIEGESAAWITNMHERGQTWGYNANYYTLFNRDGYKSVDYFAPGTVLYLAMDCEGELPDFENLDTGEVVSAASYNVNGQDTVCYKIVVNAEGNRYVCQDEVTHSFERVYEDDGADEYFFYNVFGDSLPDTVAVRDGDSWTFRIAFNIKKVDVLSRMDKQSDGTYKVKDGESVFVFDGNQPEYTYYTNSLGTYDSFLYVYITLKNVTDDVKVRATFEKRSAEYAFTSSPDYTVYVDDVPVTAAPGEIQLVRVNYDSTIKIVPADGNIIGKGEDFFISFYYMNNGVSTRYNSYAFYTEDGGAYAYFTFTAYSFYSDVDTSKPFEFNGVNIISFPVEKLSGCASYDELNNITFPDGEPVGVTPERKFELKVKMPFGKYPVLLVEYADRPSQGYYVYNANATTEEGAYSVFTFSVEGVTSSLKWMLELRDNEYNVNVHYYGDDVETILMKHGQILADCADLRTSYEGTKDGVKGVFTVIGWSTEEGGDVNTILVSGPGDLWAVTEFAPYTVTFGEKGYLTLADALKDIGGDAEGNLDLLWGYPQQLKSGEYSVPAGVTLRLPYADGAYGRKLGEATDSPSMFYADDSKGTVMLTVGEQATLTVYGEVSVGGIVGYPQSARPYQGQTSSYHAILQADGQIVVENGGLIDVNGYVVGNGKVTLKSGATSQLPFVVKDYRGGTNSSNVYYEGCVPFNIYEMPNIQTEYVINYGASEVAYAMLYAMDNFNVALIEALGDEGIIRLEEGGYIVKKTTKIDNPRYSEETKSYEPVSEFRTTIDVYGGATDGAMKLSLGFTEISTESMLLAIPYTYSSVTLHDGNYTMYNMYKIMPGATLTVANDAKLTMAATTVDGKAYQAAVIVYDKTFAEDYSGISQLASNKQLLYPVQPNGVEEGGKFVVNGTLELRGKFGGEITTENADAKIYVYAPDANLTVTSREGVYYSGQEFTVTYEQTSQAVVNTESGLTALAYGRVYSSNESGVWK